MKNFGLKDLLLNALFGALYVVLVYVFNFMAFGAIQFRIAEVLLILLFFKPNLAFGIILGTFVANLNSDLGLIDAVFGTIATSIGIIGLLLLKDKPILALLSPVISNGIIISILLFYAFESPLILSFLTVSFGQAVVLYLLGLPFYKFISNREDILELLK